MRHNNENINKKNKKVINVCLCELDLIFMKNFQIVMHN